MKTLQIKSARKIIQNKKELEDKLNVKITVKGTNVSIDGKAIDIHFASRVIEALDYRFLIEDALLLKSEDYLFEVIDIKSNTYRHDYNVIKGRLIGKKGKTLKVLENLTESYIAVKDNKVAIIAPSSEMHNAQQAVISIIKGSKQGNVYATLERSNKRKRRYKD